MGPPYPDSRNLDGFTLTPDLTPQGLRRESLSGVERSASSPALAGESCRHLRWLESGPATVDTLRAGDCLPYLERPTFALPPSRLRRYGGRGALRWASFASPLTSARCGWSAFAQIESEGWLAIRSSLCEVWRAKDVGPDRDRTGDLLNAIQARSQLRYRPSGWLDEP